MLKILQYAKIYSRDVAALFFKLEFINISKSDANIQADTENCILASSINGTLPGVTYLKYVSNGFQIITKKLLI